ncbi:MAG: hypothetical protein KF715_16505 [Candidatus Didemnitutus sp.]|nr:hypothetical protein [Candidatus Didemnitutus sp.]
MILCVQQEKLGERLATLRPLMDKYQRGEPTFPSEALKWLDEAEKAMGTLRLPEGAEMSALRGRILRAADALPAEDGHPSRAAMRRAQQAAAAEALTRAEEVLRQRVTAAEERLKFFEEKLCEGLTAFVVQNGMPPRTTEHQASLLRIWELLRQFSATRPLAIYMSASLSQTDRCYLLDRVLSRIDEGAEVSPGAA